MNRALLAGVSVVQLPTPPARGRQEAPSGSIDRLARRGRLSGTIPANCSLIKDVGAST